MALSKAKEGNGEGKSRLWSIHGVPIIPLVVMLQRTASGFIRKLKLGEVKPGIWDH